ncbi:uncharacterized protein LOC125675832 isoform X3 [Ostrea edulis]|uniref:uncharacterized protein LOC125675832 isoform X3 n=1 Tax=Ostrea edulis TaxID=37623 RepID=UPI0024AF4407|nr:uncharacterized protein LOC125675832 isoform X3 [Ostrea edulis]
MSNTRIKDYIMEWRPTYTRVHIILIPCSPSRQTVRETMSCPRNKEEWTMRAKKMKCHDHPQNCTSTDNFKYHCVLNVWGNATIELCAEERVIGGNALNFPTVERFYKSIMRTSVQHVHICITPATYIYANRSAFLFYFALDQECFQFHSVLSTKGNDDNSTDENNDVKKEQPLNILSLWIGVPAFLVVTFVVGCVSCWICRSRCQNEDTTLGANGVLLEMDRKEFRSIETKERAQGNISHAMLGSGRCYVRQLST